MNKSELKNGAIVELRNRNQYIVTDNRLSLLEIHPYYILDDFNDDLTYKGDKDVDIVKIDHSNHLDIIWTWERKEDILTDKEKAYLKAIIKLVKDKVQYIKKTISISLKQYIHINLGNDYYYYLGCFEEGPQFIGMKLNKEYTLKELGLE